MSRLKIAEWSYQIGCISAVAAVIYRLLWVVGLGAHLPETPRLVPHNLMDLSIVLLLISVASNAEAVVRRENGKTIATGKAA